MESALFAMLIVATIGGSLGVIIGMTAKIFAVSIDPRIEDVGELLPGANCGGCGFAGCADFAKAVVSGEATGDGCPVGSSEMIAKIAKVLGVDAKDKIKQVAVVLCGGNNTVAKQKIKYNGINDCKAALLVAGGPKMCSYGCLGFASCARACPFGAIEICDGLAIVHPELCVACGKCIDKCPQGLIKLVPADVEVHVFCSSPAKGAVKMKSCKVSCIGCRKCVKASDGQMLIDGFLASTNYENPPERNIIEEAKCPTSCLKTTIVNECEKKEVAA